MKHFLHHLFLPNHSNNHRAKLLHHQSLFIFIAVMLFGTVSMLMLKQTVSSRVLGETVSIAVHDLLVFTNAARQQSGLRPLTLNQELSQAAAGKAEDMFLKNYWAHDSPDGHTPWDFIRNAGYNYIDAGENLARGFNSANDVVNAWMASPEHRANMLSSNYQDVGFAVAQGDLTGEKNTVLVVQMFGSRASEQIAAAPQIPLEQRVSANTVINPPISQTPPQRVVKSAVQNTPIIDSTLLSREIGMGIIGMFIMILLLDLYVVRRKHLVRATMHTLDHAIVFGGIFMFILLTRGGVIF